MKLQGNFEAIIWQLRLPRIVMGMLTGLALGSSGAVMQVLLRNPLANPYMLGIASSAAFGASIGIIFNVGLFFGNLSDHRKRLFLFSFCFRYHSDSFPKTTGNSRKHAPYGPGAALLFSGNDHNHSILRRIGQCQKCHLLECGGPGEGKLGEDPLLRPPLSSPGQYCFSASPGRSMCLTPVMKAPKVLG